MNKDEYFDSGKTLSKQLYCKYLLILILFYWIVITGQDKPRINVIKKWIVPLAKDKCCEIGKELFKSEEYQPGRDETTLQVFERWLKNYDAKWEDVLTALRSKDVGLSILADHIEKNYIFSE